MDVVILEGPAGSGKTTAANMMSIVFGGSEIYEPKIRKEEEVRDQGSPFWSMRRNYDQLVHVLTSPSKSMVILDRFWISTYAYELIRGKVLNHTNLQDWMLLLEKEIDLILRAGGVLDFQPKVGEIRWYFTFLLPPYETLMANRNKEDRDYPFTAASELGVYQSIYDFLVQHFEGRNEVKILLWEKLVHHFSSPSSQS